MDARRYFSVIVGENCNARCPFCIAPPSMKRASEPFPVDKAAAAATWAANLGATVASVSGGGEPLMLAATDPDGFADLADTLARLYPKRDLHSNYAIPAVTRHPERLYPVFTHTTVSLWPNADINRAYMGFAAWDRTVRDLREHPPTNLRLSATLGTDWMRGIADVYAYLDFAASLGATAVTFRPLVTAPTATDDTTAWIAERRLDGAVVDGWLRGAGHEPAARTVRDAAVYRICGIDVCVYRYPADTGEPDTDFYFFRPSTTDGRYGVFTDYADDATRVPDSTWNRPVAAA